MRSVHLNERAPMRAGAKRRAAFTLVELLVVIGIIAILIGIMLPVLRRARESANKAGCLSNLHQIGLYLLQYQSQFHGRIPIYITPAYANKTVYHANVNDYTGLGLLVPANIAPKSGSESARVFYCPGTVPVSTAYHFNYVDPANPAASNPWVGRPGYSTRITYSLRMEYWAWDGGTSWNIQYPNARFDVTKTSASADAFIVPPTSKRPIFPRANEFTRRSASALIMDLNDSKFNRRAVHRGGVNALYADYSAKSVPQEYITKHVKNLEIQEAAYPNGGPPVRRAFFDMWQELDQY